MDKTITWQAHSSLRVNQDCLTTGKFPNGKKLTKEDIDNSRREIEKCERILINHGCINNQTKLF